MAGTWEKLKYLLEEEMNSVLTGDCLRQILATPHTVDVTPDILNEWLVVSSFTWGNNQVFLKFK